MSGSWLIVEPRLRRVEILGGDNSGNMGPRPGWMGRAALLDPKMERAAVSNDYSQPTMAAMAGQLRHKVHLLAKVGCPGCVPCRRNRDFACGRDAVVCGAGVLRAVLQVVPGLPTAIYAAHSISSFWLSSYYSFWERLWNWVRLGVARKCKQKIWSRSPAG